MRRPSPIPTTAHPKPEHHRRSHPGNRTREISSRPHVSRTSYLRNHGAGETTHCGSSVHPLWLPHGVVWLRRSGTVELSELLMDQPGLLGGDWGERDLRRGLNCLYSLGLVWRRGCSWWRGGEVRLAVGDLAWGRLKRGVCAWLWLKCFLTALESSWSIWDLVCSLFKVGADVVLGLPSSGMLGSMEGPRRLVTSLSGGPVILLRAWVCDSMRTQRTPSRKARNDGF